MYIKRKLAISKDLQLEFYNSVSNNINNTNNNGLSSSLSAISSSTSPLSSTSNNPLSPLPPLSPPIISSELLDSKFFLLYYLIQCLENPYQHLIFQVL